MGKDTPFTIFDDDKVKPYLDAIEGDTRAPQPTDDRPGPGDDDDAPGGRPAAPEPRPTVLFESMEH